MNLKYLFLLTLLAACNSQKPTTTTETLTNHFPVVLEKAVTLPAKETFYIFLMAGQSNMAGRGFVQPADTIPDVHVLTLNKNNEWVYAKEPLHYYEPGRTGLDCGLAFGKKLAGLYGKNITIGLVPCAIGGSSIEQWLGDSTYRNVRLYTNFMEKANAAKQYGVLKGLLWHQGESNAGNAYINYKQKLDALFTRMRNDLGYPDLPVYAGQLASFLVKKNNPHAEEINNDLESLSKSFKNFHVINTQDLTSKSDTLHFDSPSQRKMGERFAEAAYNNK
jgi:hypothetical protein